MLGAKRVRSGCRRATVVATLAFLVLATPAAANQPPEIWSASVTPATLPHTGGDVVVSAEVYDFEGAPVCCLDVELDGWLAGSSNGSDITVAIPPNLSSEPVTHTLRVIARDYDQAEASRIAGTVVVAAAPAVDAAPLVSAPTVTPTELPSTGGPVTLGLTASDDFGLSEVFAIVTPSTGYSYPLQPAGGDRYETVFDAPANPGTAPVEYQVRFVAVDDLGQQGVVDSVFRVAGRPTGRLELKTTTLDFGAVKAGKRKQRHVTLRNAGARSTLPVRGVITTSGAPFWIAGASGTAGVPFCLRPGQRLNVVVEFRPTVAGLKTGSLTVTRTDGVQPPLVAALTGTGVAKDQPAAPLVAAPPRTTCP